MSNNLREIFKFTFPCRVYFREMNFIMPTRKIPNKYAKIWTQMYQQIIGKCLFYNERGSGGHTIHLSFDKLIGIDQRWLDPISSYKSENFESDEIAQMNHRCCMFTTFWGFFLPLMVWPEWSEHFRNKVTPQWSRTSLIVAAIMVIVCTRPCYCPDQLKVGF